MKSIILVSILSIITFNAISQEFNFDKIGLYDNIMEINNYEIVHETNDTNLLNYFSYNEKGDIIEKRFNYRITQSRRRMKGDTGKNFSLY